MFLLIITSITDILRSRMALGPSYEHSNLSPSPLFITLLRMVDSSPLGLLPALN